MYGGHYINVLTSIVARLHRFQYVWGADQDAGRFIHDANGLMTMIGTWERYPPPIHDEIEVTQRVIELHKRVTEFLNQRRSNMSDTQTDTQGTDASDDPNADLLKQVEAEQKAVKDGLAKVKGLTAQLKDTDDTVKQQITDALADVQQHHQKHGEMVKELFNALMDEEDSDEESTAQTAPQPGATDTSNTGDTKAKKR